MAAATARCRSPRILPAAFRQLRVLQSELSGKGRAVRMGMLEARGEYRFMCDADFSMPIEEINGFLPPALDGYDIAIASREAPGAVRYDEPAYRHLVGARLQYHDPPAGAAGVERHPVWLQVLSRAGGGRALSIRRLSPAGRSMSRCCSLPGGWDIRSSKCRSPGISTRQQDTRVARFRRRWAPTC